MSEKDMEYIRVAAYYMWENAGKPEGKDEEFWWKACEQLGSCCCAKKETKTAAKKAPAKKAPAKKAVSKTVAKSIAKVVAKPVVKLEAKPVAKLEVKPIVKVQAKPAAKPAAKKAAKSKISPVPVKSAAKIITPLYGSVKK